MSHDQVEMMLGWLPPTVGAAHWHPATRSRRFISTRPSVDGTDFYMFNSYEAGEPGS